MILGLTLNYNRDYSDTIKSLKGLSVVDQIKIYQDIYDGEIPFNDFYWALYPENNGRNNSPCPIHEESIDGESFAIDSVRNMWQCFGKCKTVGRATQFEYMIMKKENPGVSRLDALKSLNRKFPNLPKPVIYSSNDIDSLRDGNVNLNLDFEDGKKIKLNNITNNLSVRILNSMLIEKDFSRK